MSALSVMSLLVPTAPGGTAAASIETAADDSLFAGLVAAAAPSLTTFSEDGDAAVNASLIDADAAETPAPDAAVASALAWPPIALLAPVPLSVAPPTASGSVADAADTAKAGGVAPTPPTAPVPAASLDAAVAPTASAPTMAAPTQPAPTSPAALPPVAAEAPVAARQDEAKSAPLPPLQSAPAPRSTDATATAASVSTENASVQMREPRAEAAGTSRPGPQTPASITMAASSVPASPIAAAAGSTPPAPNALSTEAAASAPKPMTPTAPAAPAAPAAVVAAVAPLVVTPAPAPRMSVSMTQQPVAAVPVAATAPAADTPEQVVALALATTASDGEADAAAPSPQQTPPPATPVPTPVRNGSARLDGRQSNAATSSGSDAKGDAQTGVQGARSILPASTPSAVASASSPIPGSSAALGDSTAPLPVATAEAAPLDAQPDLAPSQQILDAQNAAPSAQRDLSQSQLSRATVETTAQMAAQIIKKLEGRSTRFDMALTPEGLGRVDVSLEIDSDGRLAARLAFDNPAAATDMRARADELRRQLQDAGFQLTPDSLDFSERNPSSGFGGGGAFDRAPDRRAFAGAARLAAEADTVLPPSLSGMGAWASLSLTPDRVDMKV